MADRPVKRSFEPILTENKLVQAIRTASGLRFAGAELDHQMRVLRQTGHTGYTY